MGDTVQLKAFVPRQLKREVFSRLALHDGNFSRWLREQMCNWLDEQETDSPPLGEQEVGHENRGL